MQLYHGSGVVVDKPDLRIIGYTKDFSYGFYCTRLYKKNAQKAHSVRGGMNAHKLNKAFMYVFPFCDIIET